MSFYNDASLIFLAGAAAGKDGKAYNVKPVPEYGPELITNGDFATDSDWSKGTGWSISGGEANCDGTQSSFTNFSQGTAAVVGKTYIVKYTLTKSTSGSVTLRIGASSVATPRNVIGTHTEQMTCATNTIIYAVASSDFVGSIDNVSVREVLSPAADFDFSRGSNLSATRVGPDGLIEKGRENAMRYSNQFTVPGRYTDSNSAIELASNEIGYNGNSDVWKLTEDNTTASHWIRDNQDSITGTGTISVYAKYNGRHLQLRPTGIGSGVAYANFDLISGVKGTSAGTGYIDSTITRVGDTDWYRCSLTINHSGNYSWLAILVGSTSATELPSYPGDGASGIYMQYAQLEIGLAATEYIESGASTGKAGLLEDEPRFDYSEGATCPSLLLEPSRTQLMPYTEYFEGSGWSEVGSLTLTTNTDELTSPEGVNNATLLTSANATSEQYLSIGGLSTTSGQDYTLSIIAKKKDFDFIMLKFQGSSGAFSAGSVWFNLSTGAVATEDSGKTGYIKNIGNGWYKCSATATAAGTTAGATCRVQLASADNTDSVTGDGSKGAYIFGAGFEQGSYPTSYIPNHSGGTITRGVDAASTGDISSLVNSPEGTIFTESAKIQDFSLFQLDDGGQDNRITLYPRNNTTQITFILTVGGVQQIRQDPSPSGLDTTQFNKYAITWGLNDFRVYVNGVNIYTSNSNITFSSGALNDLDINIANHKQFLIFKEALSDADCTTLTGTGYDTFADMAEALNYTVYE